MCHFQPFRLSKYSLLWFGLCNVCELTECSPPRCGTRCILCRNTFSDFIDEMMSSCNGSITGFKVITINKKKCLSEINFIPIYPINLPMKCMVRLFVWLCLIVTMYKYTFVAKIQIKNN